MHLTPCKKCPHLEHMTYLDDEQQAAIEEAARRGDIHPCHKEDNTPLNRIAPRPLRPGDRGCAGAWAFHRRHLAASALPMFS